MKKLGVWLLGTLGLLLPLACGGDGDDSGSPTPSSGGSAGSSGASGRAGSGGTSGNAGRAGAGAGAGGFVGPSVGGTAGLGGEGAVGGEAGDAAGHGGEAGDAAGHGGEAGGAGDAPGGVGGHSGGDTGSGGEGGSSDGCPNDELLCNDQCVDETKQLWLFTGSDGCGQTWSIYVRVPADGEVTVGEAHAYPVWDDMYDCNDDGTAETPSTADEGEFLEQPFFEGACVAFCDNGAGFLDAAVAPADSLCFTPSETTLYFEVD